MTLFKTEQFPLRVFYLLFSDKFELILNPVGETFTTHLTLNENNNFYKIAQSNFFELTYACNNQRNKLFLKPHESLIEFIKIEI